MGFSQRVVNRWGLIGRSVGLEMLEPMGPSNDIKKQDCQNGYVSLYV